jgi:hypothetical protein
MGVLSKAKKEPITKSPGFDRGDLGADLSIVPQYS